MLTLTNYDGARAGPATGITAPIPDFHGTNRPPHTTNRPIARCPFPFRIAVQHGGRQTTTRPHRRRAEQCPFPCPNFSEDNMLRYWTAGESHGKTLLALVDGFPAGVELTTPGIDDELRRRQGGYGRGGRQRIETDRVEILTGIWRGISLGSPIALQVVNETTSSSGWTT